LHNIFKINPLVLQDTHFFLAEEVDFSRQVSLYMHNTKYIIIYFTWCPRHYYKIDKILRNLSFKSPWKISNLWNYGIKLNKSWQKCSLFLVLYKVYTFCNDQKSRWPGPLWLSWSYGSWIYNYLCNQCLSPLTLNQGR
jgi:hypothetical protein